MVGQVDPDGAKFGYFVNLRKTNLLVKPHLLSEVESIVQGTEINIVADGQWYLIGGQPFVEAYVHEKVGLWMKGLVELTRIVESQPHTAFAL